MINVVLADDHQIVIDGLMSILKEDPNIQVTGMAKNGAEVLKLIDSQSQIDVIVLDIEMEELNGVETARIIQSKYPYIKVLILSMYNRKHFIMELMKLGVKGYVLKDYSKEQLIHAIHQVYSGKVYFGLEVLSELTNTRKSSVGERVQLTGREEQVLALTGDGLTSKEISIRLDIEESTVNTHKRNLRRKLEVPNEKHLVRYAIKHGYAKL